MLKDWSGVKVSFPQVCSLARLCAAVIVVMMMSSAAWADIHLKLISGKREVKDKVSFTIEVDHEKNESPRNAKMPDFIKFLVTFAEPTSGVVILDGKGALRFDGTNQAISGDLEITYGRHVVTLQVSSPAVVTLLDVSVRGAVVREVFDVTIEAPSGASADNILEGRISALEQKVRQLEAEIEALKRGRRNQ
jgi:hypothetical protein